MSNDTREFLDAAEKLGWTHIRGITKTACGLNLWIRNELGQLVTTVDSVGFLHSYPDHQVTCPDCLHAVKGERP